MIKLRCLLVMATLTVAASAAPSVEEARALFASSIRPLFAEKCLSCHGKDPAKLKGMFDMRMRKGILVGGESGEAAVIPGKPEESPLMVAIRWEDDFEMPPKENDRLTAAEIELVRQWIAGGAPWAATAEVAMDDPGWKKPDAQGRVRVRTSGGLSPTWTNRRYAAEDLWSYRPVRVVEPPNEWSPHPVEAFLLKKLKAAELPIAKSTSRREFIRRVTYGLTGLPPTPERMAAFEKDDSSEAVSSLIDELLASPHYGERMAQHWLDVVRYADSDGFARDEFRPDAHRYRSYVIEAFNEDKPYDRFVKEQLAGDQLGLGGQEALSFLWMGPWEQTAMSVAAVTRQHWLDDVTNSVGVTFLGQQLRCAKCHDHKFDPIPTLDYYQFQALFADTTHSGNRGKYKIAKQPSQLIHILKGGSLDNRGKRVSPGALSLLNDTAGHAFEVGEQGSRAALAKWVASAKNPLTARVIVNRVWQMHFGRGLVATSNDFGRMGADPTHPELLDWLAHWFVENGWSLKKLHRLLLTTPTYQRGTAPRDPSLVKTKDPNNQLLSYFPPRRLTAEEIRDSMLAISGELNRKVGGPSYLPEINWEVAFQPRRLMGTIAPLYEPTVIRSERNRRSLYAARLRNLGHPFMEVLNRPLTELSCERRDETTVTPQVFTLLHGELAHEQALALANRIAQKNESMEDQITAVFRAVYGRKTTQRERVLVRTHLKELRALHENHTVEKKTVPTTVEIEDVIEKTGELVKKNYQLKTLSKYEDDLQHWQVDVKTRALADLCLVLFNSSEFLYVY